MAERFWSDDFDMDLLRVIPRAAEVLAKVDVPLWTYGGTSYGRLNHPSVWHDWNGTVACFGTRPDGDWKPEQLWTDAELVECSWAEVARDAWPHRYVVVVDGISVWDTCQFARTFERLMYDLRGWQKLPAGKADQLKGEVLASLMAATRDMQRLIQAGANR